MATKEILLGNIKGKDCKIEKVTATVDSTHLENPIVTVQLGGSIGAQTIDFSFEGLQGAPGTNIVTNVDGSIKIDIATKDTVGVVKPDGVTIVATADGTISVAELDSYIKVEEVDSIRDEIEEEIRTSTIGTYKIKGSSLFEDLPEPNSESFGFVYNVLNDFTTNANFLVAQEHFPAGTNVVVVNDELGYKYDVFTGVIDLSDYVKKSDVIANADVSNKLGTESIGTSTKPIYLEQGVPTEADEYPVIPDNATEETSGLMSNEDKKTFDTITQGTDTEVVLANGTIRSISELGKVADSVSADYLNRQSLEDSTDLDDLFGEGKSGLYYSSPSSSDLLNTPENVNNSFLLEVVTGEDNETNQKLTTDAGIVWFRHRGIGGWSEWEAINVKVNDFENHVSDFEDYKKSIEEKLKEYVRIDEFDSLLVEHIETIREALGLATTEHMGLVPKIPED